jgi:ATP-binding cassette subfamily C protein LapB
LRSLRAHVLDEAGKRADLVLSSAIYKKTLQLPADQRPASPAQWASQVREFESVRDFVSSSTLVVLTDLPFCLLFFAAIAWMGGSLVWVPLVAGALTMLFGALTQWPIRRSVERYQYESTQKHAMLVESMERLETITALGAQSGFLSKWERVCAATARSAMASRMASALTANVSQWLQQMATTGLIVYGVYLILLGQLTVGALIGCSILASRALAPLGQVAGLMARWHNTQISFSAVNKLMSLPLHAGVSQKTFVSMERFKHHLVLENLVFQFPRTEKAVLNIPKLPFQIGEITAVMGPVGSGKSSLLRVLAGLLQPTQGRVWVDGLDLRHLSPADWRAQVSWVSQDVVLFRGSLRENLLIASPRVKDERFLQVLSVCGLESWVMEHPMGLDMPLGEAGQSLSGGQRQMVALARALLADAPILLLDEPTSAMDMAGEQQLLTRLAPELTHRLVVIATHRPGPLELASRLLILDQGRIAADGPRDAVLQAVKEGKVQRARPVLKPVTEVAA